MINNRNQNMNNHQMKSRNPWPPIPKKYIKGKPKKYSPWKPVPSVNRTSSQPIKNKYNYSVNNGTDAPYKDTTNYQYNIHNPRPQPRMNNNYRSNNQRPIQNNNQNIPRRTPEQPKMNSNQFMRPQYNTGNYNNQQSPQRPPMNNNQFNIEAPNQPYPNNYNNGYYGQTSQQMSQQPPRTNNQFNRQPNQPNMNANNYQPQRPRKRRSKKVNGMLMHRRILGDLTLIPPYLNLSKAIAECAQQGASPQLLQQLISAVSQSLPKPLPVNLMNDALNIGIAYINQRRQTWMTKLLHEIVYGKPAKNPFGSLISIAMETLFALTGDKNKLNITFRTLQIANHYGFSDKKLKVILSRAIYYKKQYRANKNRSNNT